MVKKKQIDGTQADGGVKVEILSTFMYKSRRKSVLSGAIKWLSHVACFAGPFFKSRRVRFLCTPHKGNEKRPKRLRLTHVYLRRRSILARSTWLSGARWCKQRGAPTGPKGQFLPSVRSRLQTDNKNSEAFHATELDWIFEKVPAGRKTRRK